MMEKKEASDRDEHTPPTKKPSVVIATPTVIVELLYHTTCSLVIANKTRSTTPKIPG
jgi:hypothetical protein